MPEKACESKKNASQEVYLVEKYNLVGPFHDLDAAKRFIKLMTLFGGSGLDMEVVEIKEDFNPNALEGSKRIGPPK